MRQAIEKTPQQAGQGEALEAKLKGAEVLTAKREGENLAGNECVMEEIVSRENLRKALQRVKSNGGAPGVDKMTVKELPEYLKTNWLTIKEQLLSGSYQPQPVRRVEIPKPEGGVRKLGVPSVLDRFIRKCPTIPILYKSLRVKTRSAD